MQIADLKDYVHPVPDAAGRRSGQQCSQHDVHTVQGLEEEQEVVTGFQQFLTLLRNCAELLLSAQKGQLQLHALPRGCHKAEMLLCADQASSTGCCQADGKGEREGMR